MCGPEPDQEISERKVSLHLHSIGPRWKQKATDVKRLDAFRTLSHYRLVPLQTRVKSLLSGEQPRRQSTERLPNSFCCFGEGGTSAGDEVYD